MEKQRTTEIAVGIFMVLGIAALVMLAMKVSNVAALTENDGYEVTAKFENIGGLKVKAPVNMAGVRIGRVMRIDFDQNSYKAVVHMRISPQYNKLPLDTSASIFTAGVLGESYVGLEAGAEESYLTQGKEITMTQSAMILEQLVGKFLFEKAASSSAEKQ